MENQPLTEKPRVEKLGRYYLVALLILAASMILSQVFVQKLIRDQKDDSHLVNLSGRQRMLSQQISKYAWMLSATDEAPERQKYLNDLQKAFGEWKKVHSSLRIGDGTAEKSDTIQQLFLRVQGNYQEMEAGARGIITTLNKDMMVNRDRIRADVHRIIANENEFLEGMEQVVSAYDRIATAKVANLKNTQLFLFALSLIIIVFEIFYVFLPSARAIRKSLKKHADSEARSRKIALETSALYTSLEQAYQDLLVTDMPLEDYTVYARCNVTGDFTYYADRFVDDMEFEEEKPSNFFTWLEQEGYERKYLHNIKLMVLSGNTWNGEVKVVNNSGDFVWLKLNLIPILNERKEVETLMVIGINETEMKEAEAISREINKDKIARKVKEQQFRSALILEGQEEERKRISRDMHDGVGQLLSAMKFNLEGIHSVQSGYEHEKLKTSKDLLKNVIREVRRISFNLTPSALSDYGIVSVLNKFCKEISKVTDLHVTFENRTGFLSRLEGKVENNLYRIVQEAVNNAIKYAEAKEVNIVISHNSRYLNLEITDDGKGFDIEKLEAKGHFTTSGHGIFNIRERADFIAAQCTISSQAGKGTTIGISLPLD